VSHADMARRFTFLAAALAPAVAVLIARTAAPHAGPSSAAAKTTTPERIEPVQAMDGPMLTGKQPALAAALRSREYRYESPFVVPLSEAAREGLLRDTQGKAQAAKAPEFVVTTVVAGAQSVAIINGKVRRIGDELGDGWSVVEIDAPARRATVAHPEHGRLVLKIKTELE